MRSFSSILATIGCASILSCSAAKCETDYDPVTLQSHAATLYGTDLPTFLSIRIACHYDDHGAITNFIFYYAQAYSRDAAELTKILLHRTDMETFRRGAECMPDNDQKTFNLLYEDTVNTTEQIRKTLKAP